MSDGRPEDATCVRVQHLTDALTALGDALAAGDLDAMLASEATLASLASELSRYAVQTLPPDARGALASARLALQRCERLGSSLQTFVACSLTAQGRAGDYARDGRPEHAAARPSLIARG